MKDEKEYRLRTSHLEKHGIGKEELAKIDGITPLTVRRWYYGLKVPSLDILIELACRSNTNVSYLLHITEADNPLDRCIPHLRVSQIKKEKALTYKSLTDMTGLNTNTIQNCMKNEVLDPKEKLPKLSTLKLLADTFKVSLDYLLGLSDYRQWGEKDKASPFSAFPKGHAIHIKIDEYESDCLIDSSGENLVFPNGEIIPFDADKVAFAKVYDIREEAKRRRSGDVL